MNSILHFIELNFIIIYIPVFSQLNTRGINFELN